MKLYIIDMGGGYNFTYLLGDLGIPLKQAGDEFRTANPKLGIDWWHDKFVAYLKKKYGLVEVEPEKTRPQSHGVDYVTP